jgi:hypothetical protein
MSQHATARIYEAAEPAGLTVTDLLAQTARAVAAGHDAELNRALESVSWERRGLLGRLSWRPRPARIPGGGG